MHFSRAHDGWRGLIGLLVSPGVGLIFFFPIVVLLPLGAKYMYKDNRALFFSLHIHHNCKLDLYWHTVLRRGTFSVVKARRI